MSGLHEALIAAAGAGVVCWTVAESAPRLRFTIWNQQMVTLTGYSLEDVNDVGWLERVSGSKRVAGEAPWCLPESTVGSASLPEELPIVRRDGERRVLRVATSGIVHAGQPTFIGIVTDITEHKRTEARLRASEARYRRLVEHATDAMYLYDGAGRIIDVNENACTSVGYTRDELLGLTALDLCTTLTAADMAAIEQRLAAGETATIDACHRRKDGVTFPVEVRLCSFEVDGAPRSLALARDTSDRRRAEVALRESEERCRLALDAANLGTFRFDASDAAAFFDARSQAHHGLERSHVTAKELFELIHPDDATAVIDAVRSAHCATGLEASFTSEHRIVRPNGDIRWCAVRGQLHRALDGGVAQTVRVVGTTHDITDRKRTEALMSGQARVLERIATGAPIAEILAEVIRFLEQAISGAGCAIGGLDRQGNALRFTATGRLADDGMPGLDGLTLGVAGGTELLGILGPVPVILTDLAADPRWAGFQELLQGLRLTACWSFPIVSSSQDLETSAPRGGLGAVLVFPESDAAPTDFEREAILMAAHLAGVAFTREHAVLEIRESEARYGVMSEMTRSVTMAIRRGADGQTRIEWAKPRFGLISGYSREEVETAGWQSLFHPDDRPQLEVLLRRMLAGETVRGELRYVTKHDGTLNVLFHGKLLEAGPRPGEGVMIGALLDITSLKAAEEALRRSEEELRDAQALAHVGNWRYDLATGRGVCSDETNRILGWAAGEHHASEVAALCHPDDAASVASAWDAAITQGTPFSIEHRLIVDGEVKWVAVHAKRIRDAYTGAAIVSGVTQDITARRKLEAQFHQAQKMEAVGQLAGGVAHDFNNLLTVINGSVDLLLEELHPDDPHHDELKQVRNAGIRAAALTQQLLAFSRRQILTTRTLDLNQTVIESGRLLRRLIGEDITVTMQLDPELPKVKADPNQLQQILLNLVVNARDAMPKGGLVRIETRCVEVHHPMLTDFRGLPPGRYIELSVADTGCGLTDEAKQKLFEPFFTTKGVGKGTGLGLATVYGIVQQSGGHISAESDVGQGATFRILLPVAEAAVTERPVDVIERQRGKGVETVLLVEDDDAVRRLTRTVLTRFGYTVLAASNGRDALDLIHHHHHAVDLLLTDVVMPEMSGRQVADAVRAIRPDIAVVFMSGYTDDAVVRHGVLEDKEPFLQKPFAPAALGALVRETLDGRRPAAG